MSIKFRHDAADKLASLVPDATRIHHHFQVASLEIKYNTDPIPERYIINENATVLFWKDGTKTVVKRMKGDKHNARLAFLTAYFQKHSGMSKTKSNKYLDNL